MSSYEDTHVHAVYEAIAPHFSATRHSPWPFVKSFLLAQSPASIGLDIGCGNGKYLAVNPALHILASDRSPSLVALAKQQHGAREHKKDKSKNTTDDTPSGSTNAATAAALLTADSLSLPFRPHSADFIICIAVIHHFSSVERRRAAIEAILGCLRRETGRALIYVWALEQGTSRRGWHEGCEQDTLVPWVMKRKKNKAGKKGSNGANEAIAANEPPLAPDDDQDQQSGQDKQTEQTEQTEQTYHRYYHLYRQGELEEDARHAGGEVCESGYERDNWWVILKTGGGGGGQADRQNKDRQGELNTGVPDS